MGSTVELKTISSRKWSLDFAGLVPTIHDAMGVLIGDDAVDTSTGLLYKCIKADAPSIWVLISDKGIYDLENMFNTSKSTNYAEPIRNVTNRLIGWDVWTSSDKTSKLFEQRRFFGEEESEVSYDRLVSKITKDLINNKILTETRSYINNSLEGCSPASLLINKTKIIT